MALTSRRPVALRAADMSGATTGAVVKRLIETGPPYLFASYTRLGVLHIGFTFTLCDENGVDVVFEITRWSTPGEFYEKYPGDRVLDPAPNQYYEAEVRD